MDRRTARSLRVPSGYSLRGSYSEGPIYGGFGNDRVQTAFFFARSELMGDMMYPLVVYAAPAGASNLRWTENRDGELLNIGGVTALYHDGIWAPGPGYGEQKMPDGGVIHWRRDTFHSLRIDTDERSLAVRGSRSHGVELRELVGLAGSVVERSA